MPCRDTDICTKNNCSDDPQWITLSLKLYLTAHQFLTNFTHLLKLRLPECNANFKVLAPSGALNVTTAALTSITQTEYSKRQLQRPGLFYDMFSSSECETAITAGDIKFKVASVLGTLQGTFDSEDLSARIENTLFLLEQIPSHMPSRKLEVLSLFLEEITKSFDPTEQSLRRPLHATQTNLVLNFVITFIRNWGESRSQIHTCLKSCRFCESVINDDIREWGTLCCKDAKDFYEVWQEWVARQSDIADLDDESVQDIETICASPDQWDDTCCSPDSSCSDLFEQGANLPKDPVCARYRQQRSISPDFADAICDVEKKSEEWVGKVCGKGDLNAIKSSSRQRTSEVEEISSQIKLAKGDRSVPAGTRIDVPAKTNEFDRIQDEDLIDGQEASACRPASTNQTKVSLYRPLYRSRTQAESVLGLTDTWQQPTSDKENQFVDEITIKTEALDDDEVNTENSKNLKPSLYRPEPIEDNKDGLRKTYRDSKGIKIKDEVSETGKVSLYRDKLDLTKNQEIWDEEKKQGKEIKAVRPGTAITRRENVKPNMEMKSQTTKIAEAERDVKPETRRHQTLNKEISAPTVKKVAPVTTDMKDSKSDQSPTRNPVGVRPIQRSDISPSKRTATTETRAKPRKSADLPLSQESTAAGGKTAPRVGEKPSETRVVGSQEAETIGRGRKHEVISGLANIDEDSVTSASTFPRRDEKGESMEKREKDVRKKSEAKTTKSTSIAEGKRNREDTIVGEVFKGSGEESKVGKADLKLREDVVKKSEYSYGRSTDKSRDTDDEEKLTRRQVGKKAGTDIAAAAGEEMDELSKSKEAPGERRKKADAADSERRGALYRPDEEGKVAGGDGAWKGRSNAVKQGADELDLMNGQKPGGEKLGAVEDKTGLTADSRKKKEEGGTKKESRLLDTSRMTSDDYSKINGTRNHKRKPPLSKLQEEEIGPANPIEYQLSNEHFVRLGWTVLPVTKSMRKIVQYQARTAKPHLDWFKKRKMDGTLYYGDGFSPFIQFHPDESGEVFYPNGRLAIKVHRPENRNYDMYTVFTPGGKDSLGIGRQPQIVAVFDTKGNGVLFNENGDIRLSYNQIGGMCIDNPSGDPYAWLWSRERRQPVTETMRDERSIAHLEKYLPVAAADAIGKSGGSRRTASSATSRNKEKKVAEQKPVVEEQEDEATSGSDFEEDTDDSMSHIKMVCMKLNDYLSLRIVDRKNITLNFSSGCKSIKIHLGTILNLKKVVATYTVDSNEKYSIQENKYQSALMRPIDSTSSLCEFTQEMRKVKEYADERNKYMQKYKPFAGKSKGKAGCCKSC